MNLLTLSTYRLMSAYYSSGVRLVYRQFSYLSLECLNLCGSVWMKKWGHLTCVHVQQFLAGGQRWFSAWAAQLAILCSAWAAYFQQLLATASSLFCSLNVVCGLSCVVFRRRMYHAVEEVVNNPFITNRETRIGVPQHFGVYYAIGKTRGGYLQSSTIFLKTV